MVSRALERRMWISAVTRGTPSTIAVAAIRPSLPPSAITHFVEGRAVRRMAGCLAWSRVVVCGPFVCSTKERLCEGHVRDDGAGRGGCLTAGGEQNHERSDFCRRRAPAYASSALSVPPSTTT